MNELSYGYVIEKMRADPIFIIFLLYDHAQRQYDLSMRTCSL